jgi:hypothetical protein
VFRQALALAARIAPDAKNWPPPAVTLADAQEGLGDTLMRKNLPEAEEHLRAALAAREQLVAQFPANHMFKVQLGGALHNFGVWVNKQPDRGEEALALFMRARTLQEEVLAKTPSLRQSRLFLINHLRLIANCQMRLGHGADLLATAQALAAPEFDTIEAAFSAAQAFMHAQRLLRAQGESPLVDCAAAAMQALVRAEGKGFAARNALDAKLFAPLHQLPEWDGVRERVAERAQRRRAEQTADNGRR